MDKFEFMLMLQAAMFRFEEMPESQIYLHLGELHKGSGKYILMGMRFADYVKSLEVKNDSTKN